MKLTETINLPEGYEVNEYNIHVALGKFSKIYTGYNGDIFWRQEGNILEIYELTDDDYEPTEEE